MPRGARRSPRIAGWTALVLAVALAPWPASAAAGVGRAELRAGLAKHLRSVGGLNGAWVRDLDAGRKPILFARRARRARILASNTKLFTTSAVLDRFGPDQHLVTKVFTRAKRSGPGGRRLEGNIALVGVGDPALASESFASARGLPLTPLGSLARQIDARGIEVVRGDIIADDSIFDRQRSVPQTGITGGPYLTPLSGLSYDSGLVDGRFANDPAREAGRALEEDLVNRGVRVRGRVHVRGTSRRLRKRAPLASVRSPKIGRLVSATNKPSNNFFAEMLLKRLAARPQRAGTTARGAGRAERFAASVGAHVELENGSGLSRRDVASPRSVGRLLTAMARRGGALRRSLPVAGREGTLGDRMEGTAAEKRCRAKTGTLDGVSALSGYCRAGGRHLIAFSILFNGVDIARAQNAEDRMAALIARYRRG